MILEGVEFPKSLGSDNHSGVHPRVMEYILAANRGHAHSYGLDDVSRLAEKEFFRVFGKSTQVHYVFNGTAANVIGLSSVLKRYHTILCSAQAHLHLDECGAPEALAQTKVVALPSLDGKIHPEQTTEWLQRFGDQHFSQPKLVSLTQPTELGVVYTLEELEQWRKWADHHRFLLHLDGTRLANAAHTLGCELKDLVRFFDVVSFGGTKNGLLGAEAILSFDPEIREDLKFHRKQMLNLPSKTRFLAAQYLAYLQDDFYKNVSRDVCSRALDLKEKLSAFPEIEIQHPVQSNALFVKLPKAWIKPLKEHFFFYIWDVENHVARWMISFDWSDEDSDRLIHLIHEVKKHVQLS